MNKTLWFASATAAAVFTAGVVSLNNTPDFARQRSASQGSATLAAATAPVASSAGPVVVEFFTSQGCSSCPPSDRLAGRLAREAGVLVIQRPVTYWDRLGWKDTLGEEANTALQRSYAGRGLTGRNGVYTPQAVVNGRAGLVGSSETALRRQIALAGQAAGVRIRVGHKADGSAEAIIAGSGPTRADVLLVGLDRDETVAVSRGENGGRQLRYTNIWKGERKLGALTAGEASFMIDPADRQIAGANRYAVIVRQGPDGPILAGRMLPRG